MGFHSTLGNSKLSLNSFGVKGTLEYCAAYLQCCGQYGFKPSLDLQPLFKPLRTITNATINLISPLLSCSVGFTISSKIEVLNLHLFLFYFDFLVCYHSKVNNMTFFFF